METVKEIKPCEDPVTKIFFGKFGYKVVYFWLGCNIMFIVASLYHGTLTQIVLPFESSVNPSTLPLLTDKCFYIFLILGACGIVLINQILKRGPTTFADLWNNKVLQSKTRMKKPVDIYNEQLKEVEKKMNSKKSYFYAVLYVLISVFYTLVDYYRIPPTESPLIVYCDIRIFPLSGVVVYSTYALLYFLLFVMIYKGVMLLQFLRKLHNTFTFQVVSLHSDRCGGFKPVENLCVAFNYIIFIFFIVFVVFYTFPQGGESIFSLYIGLPLYLVFATFFFFYPLWPIHESMKAQINTWDIPDRKFDVDYRERFDEIIDKGVHTGSEIIKKAQKMPSWPLDLGGLIWFLAAVFIPVASVTAIVFNVNEVIIFFTAVSVPVLYIFMNRP